MFIDKIIRGAVVGGIVGGVVGGLGSLIFALMSPQRFCPDCKTPLPKIGWKHRRPGWNGGWICPQCRCEVDRKGNKVQAS